MLFNSIDFAVFIPVVFILYWFIFNHNLRLQNLLIVIASYVFYGWWDWRFLSLILFSTLVDYSVGLGMLKYNNPAIRKILLWTSILVNIGFLGFFKYYNFFLENFADAFSFFGTEISANSLNIILPVGISFYTFQTLSYSIDVYRRKLEPTRDFIAFAAFVAFFPQLVAGPIERATHLLPQFYSKRKFDYHEAKEGMGQIIWGLFKKMVIADNCALVVNQVFDNASVSSGSALVLGAVLFAFQIYADFSGYSSIAIGLSKLLGFRLMQNFDVPYFSRDIAEFWRRWHISLSTWFRDYLYIPLGGSRVVLWKKVRNIFVIFIVSGFWHGANWTFIAWGALNAVFFLPLLIANKNRVNLKVVATGRRFPTLKELIQILITFILVDFAWIFFRAESLQHAFLYIRRIFSKSLFDLPYVFGVGKEKMILLTVFILGVLIVEWVGREKKNFLSLTDGKNRELVQWTLYYILAVIIFLFHGQQQEFIYFQF